MARLLRKISPLMNNALQLVVAAKMLNKSTVFVFWFIAILSRKAEYKDDIIMTRGMGWGIRKISSVPAINEKRTTSRGDFANFTNVFFATLSARPDLIIPSEIKNEATIKIKFSEKKMILREKKTAGETRKLNTCKGVVSPINKKHNSKYEETISL